MASADSGVAGVDGGDAFFGRQGLSFRDLGLRSEVADAAVRAGFVRPSRMQQLAIPDQLADEEFDGRPAHVVLTGETGSGKTLAYVLPLVQRLLDAPQAGARALVLVPSPALCDQVLGLANRLVDANGAPLVRAEMGGLAEAPFALPGNPLSNAPAIVVSTPTAIIDHLQVHYTAASSRRWFVRHVAHLVLDEADTLLSAGYDKPLRSLFSLLLYGRYDHPMLTQIFSTGGQQRHLYQTLSMLARGSYEATPQLVFAAATMPAGNSPRAVGSMLANALPSARWPRSELVHRTVTDVSFEWRELERRKPLGRPEVVLAAPRRTKSDSDEPADDEDEISDDVLATLISPTLAPAVAGALRETSKAPCALVFCNKAMHADALAAGLRLEGIRAATYHRAVPRAEREELLAALATIRPAVDAQSRAAADSLVLVCTDAAARGLDLPAVEHVIHAEFAQNAVSFLHRSGRTGRAGRKGRVTCFYGADDRELVGKLLEAMDADEPLEPVFSRKRSFRKRIRREDDANAQPDQGPTGRATSPARPRRFE
jgi:superfamily II DNA/RNA helicase